MNFERFFGLHSFVLSRQPFNNPTWIKIARKSLEQSKAGPSIFTENSILGFSESICKQARTKT